MNIKDLDYKLPQELIAQKPVSPRDSAKLLIFDQKINQISESTFKNIADYFTKGDVIVFNKTKVFPARVLGIRNNKKKIEILFLAEITPKVWEVLIRGKIKDGEIIKITKNFWGEVLKNKKVLLKVNLKKSDVYSQLEKVGRMPLPPYIKRNAVQKDSIEYQTVFAHKIGSAAAPTASLHFTKSLLLNLKNKGIKVEYVTLHVGLGTFQPIKSERVEDHEIHSEWIEIDDKTANSLNAAKKSGARVIACGTTVLRVLESVCENSHLKPFRGFTKLFIYPGYKFKFVNGLITNFHTPKSSLLALVYAFIGKQNVQRIYRFAIKKKYRFFSYGDGMLLLPKK